MSRKVKVFISVLLVMGLLVMGGTAAALAQEETAPTPEKMSPALQTNGCLAKVAEILEIPQEKLIAAFQQAQREIVQAVKGTAPGVTARVCLKNRVSEALRVTTAKLVTAAHQVRGELREGTLSKDKESILGRMAEILEVSPEDLTPALKQVCAAIQQEVKVRLRARLVAAEMREQVLVRVAEILEIPQEKLIAAFQQVCREVREGALTRVRDRIMEQECIAKNSALQVKRCLKSRLMISGCTLSNAPISQRN